jgi:hypothetical protein
MKHLIDLKKKKFLYLIFFFLLSVFAAFIFLYFERKILGLSSTYHPDSAQYLLGMTFKSYSYLSLDFSLFSNFKNFINLDNLFSGTLYYSISNLFHELQGLLYDKFTFNFSPYRSLIKLNIFVYCLTNLLVLNFFIKNNKNHDLKILIGILIFCFLPYKLHLTVNILKESLVFFFLTLYLFYSNIYVLIISFLFGSSLRGLYSLYFLNFVDFKNFFVKKNLFILILISITWFFVITYFVSLDNFINSFTEFIKERNIADMGGREFDTIPNFAEYGNLAIILRLILWPIFILSGIFIFYSDNFFLYILGLEIIILQITLFYCKKKFLFSIGLLLFLALLAIYANTFTAYFRYGYLAIQIVFLKILLSK